jgi:uncharacterized protein (DUF2141 family)
MKSVCGVAIVLVAFGFDGGRVALGDGGRVFRPGDQARDTAVTPTGKAIIRGVVVSADETSTPIRRAVVTLGGLAPDGRTTITSDDGRFEFAALPAGQYSVVATKAAYLRSPYGATRPGRPGTPIAISDDQVQEIRIVMARGGVITGTIRGTEGEPAAGVRVAAIDAHDPAGIDRAFSNAQFVNTDDRGVYRMFGLSPSEYVVMVVQDTTGSGEIGRRAAADAERLLAELQARKGRPAGPVSTPPPSPPPSFTLAPTYYPGTSVLREAARVRVNAGETREGLDFTAGAVPVARIIGTVAGDVRNLAAVRMLMTLDGVRQPPSGGSTPVLSQPPDAQGRFFYSNVAPGRYRIVARAVRGDAEPARLPTSGAGMSSSGGSPPPAPPGESLYALADVEVSGSDVTLALTLQPGVTMTGRVRFEGDTPPPPKALESLRIGLSPPGGTYSSSAGATTITNTYGGASATTVKADGTFELRNIGPGVVAMSIRFTAAISANWWVKSAVAGGIDLLDAPFEVALGSDYRDVVVTLSDRRTELSGMLQTPTGQPAPEYFIIVFPESPALRVPGSRRILAVRPATDGRFVMANLPAGDYLMAALVDVMPNEWNDPKFLERVAPAGVKVALADGEKKVQDLRIARQF